MTVSTLSWESMVLLLVQTANYWPHNLKCNYSAQSLHSLNMARSVLNLSHLKCSDNILFFLNSKMLVGPSILKIFTCVLY